MLILRGGIGGSVTLQLVPEGLWDPRAGALLLTPCQNSVCESRWVLSQGCTLFYV